MIIYAITKVLKFFIRPPLKIYLFPAPDPPFLQWVGRKGDFFPTFTAAKLQCCVHTTQIWFLSRSSNRF